MVKNRKRGWGIPNLVDQSNNVNESLTDDSLNVQSENYKYLDMSQQFIEDANFDCNTIFFTF